MKPIETVDDAIRTVADLAGWGEPGQLAVSNAANDELTASLLADCYKHALKRTEGLVLSRARLLRAWDVLNAHGVLR